MTLASFTFYCSFVNVIEKNNYSNLNSESWSPRYNTKHRADNDGLETI